MLNWVDIDDQTQQRMMEVKRLHDTGYHEEVLDTKTPYEIYLSKAEELLGSVNRGKISTEKYRFEI